MICPNCGSENSNDVSQCTFCGQRFAPKDPQPAADASKNTAENPDYYKAGENPAEGSTNQWNGWNQQQPNQNQNWNDQQAGPNNQGWNNQQTGSYNQGWNNQQAGPNNQGWNNQQAGPNNQGWNNQQAGPNNQGWNNQQAGPNNQGWSNQNWYNGQYPGGQPIKPKEPNRGFAMASLITGIVSIFFLCFVPYLSLPLDIVGIVLGIMALKKPGSKGIAIAGICVSAVILVASIIMLAMVFYIMANMDQFESFYNEFYNYYDMEGLFLKIRHLFK